MGGESGRGSGWVGSDFLSAIAGRVGSRFRRVGSGQVQKCDPWTTLIWRNQTFWGGEQKVEWSSGSKDGNKIPPENITMETKGHVKKRGSSFSERHLGNVIPKPYVEELAESMWNTGFEGDEGI